VAKTTLPEVPRGLTFEDVWAALMENRQQLKDLAEDLAEKHLKERKESDRRMKEIDRELKEAARLSKENSKQIGGLHRSFGELAVHMVASGIINHFNEQGYYFESALKIGLEILDNNQKVRTEVDILLENDKFLIAVEVKSKPKENDIEHHLKRLEIVREHRNKYHDTRKIHGAIAGAVFSQEVKKLTLDAGLYVLEQSGDTMKMDVPKGFVPREW